MAKELGIGVRVWIDWHVSDHPESAPRCAEFGTVVDGPIGPGAAFLPGVGHFNLKGIFWRVRLDGTHGGYYAAYLLHPIDDDETQEITEELTECL